MLSLVAGNLLPAILTKRGDIKRTIASATAPAINAIFWFLFMGIKYSKSKN
tara:strand:+ start:25 stop:177 length:153 start_codon:yes stop_codon:yes gene_type:complete